MDRPKRRKLLVASVGIASVSYALAACGKDQHPVSGNLPAPEPTPTMTSPVTGNLPAPPPPDAAPAPSASAAPTASATTTASAAPTGSGKTAPKK